MITICIGLGLPLCWFVVPYVLRRFQVARLRTRCREKRAIVLTYDDGPGARVTPRINELLESFGTTATFFPLGFKLEASGSLLDGHELGSHSYRHLHAWKSSPISVYGDIDRGIESISRLSSYRLFRPPYGKLTLATLTQIWARRCSIAWWTIDSTDTWPNTVPVSRILERIKRDGGGVILMHDHDRPMDQEREDYVIELTRSVLEFSRTGGFTVCRMSEVMGGGLVNGKSS